jgi:hypothetical protein
MECRQCFLLTHRKLRSKLDCAKLTTQAAFRQDSVAAWAMVYYPFLPSQRKYVLLKSAAGYSLEGNVSFGTGKVRTFDASSSIRFDLPTKKDDKQ